MKGQFCKNAAVACKVWRAPPSCHSNFKKVKDSQRSKSCEIGVKKVAAFKIWIDYYTLPLTSLLLHYFTKPHRTKQKTHRGQKGKCKSEAAHLKWVFYHWWGRFRSLRKDKGHLRLFRGPNYPGIRDDCRLVLSLIQFQGLLLVTVGPTGGGLRQTEDTTHEGGDRSPHTYPPKDPPYSTNAR